MRFAHLSDTHLGNRQYGILEREEDYYEIFDKTIDKIIELDVDFVIHSGDLFDGQRPSTNTFLAFQRGLLKLNNAGIPIYAISGNHDIVMRKGIKPPIDLFEELGLRILRHDNGFMEGDVFICGVQFIPSSQKRVLDKILERFSDEAKKHAKSIIVLHQGIKKFIDYGDDSYELELNELPENFNYYAFGHLHNYIEEDWGKGKLIYPGSMEVSKSNEIAQINNKGFCVVDLSEDVPSIERITIELSRRQCSKNIEYDKLYDELEDLKSKIKGLDKKPLLHISVFGGDSNSSDIHELIQDELGKDTLNLRISYTSDEGLNNNNLPENDILNPRRILKEKILEKYDDEDIANLSVDLMVNLSSKRIEDAKYLSDNYYEEHYSYSEEDIESDE
jgi:DNA repair exonuclease SbcCD nuclease subunit